MNEVWRKAINVIKCNLGKVNRKAMLLGRFPNYAGGCPVPLAGAPHDLYTQLLAFSSSQSVATTVCACHFVLWFLLFLKQWLLSGPTTVCLLVFTTRVRNQMRF